MPIGLSIARRFFFPYTWRTPVDFVAKRHVSCITRTASQQPRRWFSPAPLHDPPAICALTQTLFLTAFESLSAHVGIGLMSRTRIMFFQSAERSYHAVVQVKSSPDRSDQLTYVTEY